MLANAIMALMARCCGFRDRYVLSTVMIVIKVNYSARSAPKAHTAHTGAWYLSFVKTIRKAILC